MEAQMSGLIGILVLALFITFFVWLASSMPDFTKRKCPGCLTVILEKTGDTHRAAGIVFGTTEEEWRCPSCGHTEWHATSPRITVGWSGGGNGGGGSS